jgi:hypothetical protein
MALKIKNGKVINIAPPRNLTKKQLKKIEILDNNKPFRYLIEFVIAVAKKIQSEVGLRYIILSPDNDNLKDKYNNLGFQKLYKSIEWMYLKI